MWLILSNNQRLGDGIRKKELRGKQRLRDSIPRFRPGVLVIRSDEIGKVWDGILRSQVHISRIGVVGIGDLGMDRFRVSMGWSRPPQRTLEARPEKPQHCSQEVL